MSLMWFGNYLRNGWKCCGQKIELKWSKIW